MTLHSASKPPARLEAIFGLGRSWSSQAGSSATVWESSAYHLLWTDGEASDVELRRLWEARKGRQPYPVVLLAPSDDGSKVRVAGPQASRPVRELPAGRVLDLLETSRRQGNARSGVVSLQESLAVLKRPSFPDCVSRTSLPLTSC